MDEPGRHRSLVRGHHATKRAPGRGKAAFWAAALCACVLGPASTQSDVARGGAGQPAAARSSELVVGPGKVKLTFTRDGRWIDFTPVWNGGGSLFSLGGLFVCAKGPDGRLTQILNSATDEMRVGENASRIRTSCEGSTGGSRSPSSQPDDDRDGRIDEDRLDGIDNDGDGAVDEDFAAIGDEMAATCYYAPAIGGSSTQVAVHQEAYAWALPHIDGTVMLSFRIKNIGQEALDGVRVGALFEKQGPFYYSTWLISLPGERDDARASVAVCEDLHGVSMGFLAFCEDGSDGRVWNGGLLEDPEQSGTSLVERLSGVSRSGSLDAESSPVAETSPDASVFKSKERRIDAKALIYQASPDLGTIGVGEEVRVDLAFFAAREKKDVETATINAFRTFGGDGTNRYLPPPVSMTPRVLWGSYRPLEDGQGGEGRVVIDFDPAGPDPVSPWEVSIFSGIEAGDVAREELGPGIERITLKGSFIESALRKGERIIVKGRLSNGEFFEAILRPEENPGEAAVRPDADLFWQEEGRLEVALDLLASSPNPFRTATTISYEVPALIEQPDGARIETKESLELSVKVYNVVGRLVSVLAEDVLPPGRYTTEWRGVDDQGNPVASGVYYVRLQIGKKFLTQRLILLK